MRLTSQSHLSPGTFEIDQSISFVPETLRRLDPYGGTFEIDQLISNVPSVSGGTFEIDRSISFVAPTLFNTPNLAEIKASHWSRASNAGL